MTAKNKYVAAVDIGTTKIVATIGKKNAKGRLEILGIGKAESTGVKRGVVLNIEETASSIQKAVNEAQEKSGIQFERVFVGIAGQHIKSIKSRGYRNIDPLLSEIVQNDVDELNRDMYKTPVEAGEEIFHVIPQSYTIDNESGIKNPVGMSGKRLEANFHIIVGKIASAKNIKKCVERAGLQVEALILEPLASADAVLTGDEREAGVALVDIGGGTTDLAVFYEGVIRHTAVIPFGGNVITSDIKTGCSILQRQAERLKVEYGSALGDFEDELKVVSVAGINGREPKEITFKTLAHIIQARMEEIIDEVAFEIANSGYADKLGAGLSITGGGAMLKHLPQLVKFKSGFDVRIGYPNSLVISLLDENINHPSYATSIGLLLKGFEHMAQQKEEPVEKKLVEKQPESEEEQVPAEKKQGLFSLLKNSIRDIFEEKDSRM